MNQIIFFGFIIMAIYKLCECSDLEECPNLFQDKSDISQTKDNWCTLSCHYTSIARNNKYKERLTQAQLFDLEFGIAPKSRFFSSVINWCSNACNTVSKAIVDASKTVQTAVTNAYNTVAEGVKQAYDIVSNGVIEAYDIVSNGVIEAYDIVSDTVTSTCNTVVNGIKTECEFVSTGVKNAFITVISGVNNVFNANELELEEIFNTTSFFLGETMKEVKKWWEKSEIREVLKEIFNPKVTTCGDLVYTYYDKTDIKKGKDIHYNSIDDLRETTFNSTKDTIFSFHGWGRDGKYAPLNSAITSNIFKKHDVNVFVVDWSEESGRILYHRPISNLPRIGKFVADFIKDLKKKFGVKSSNLILVGFSLGAHLAGYVGRFLNGDVETLVGLDPAMLSALHINVLDDNNYLTKSYARFVQVIYTNKHYLASSHVFGDATYHPNGGGQQPACLFCDFQCSHSMAYEYYAESLASDRFVAQKCFQYSEYTSGECKGPKSIMGMLHVDRNASGDYYLDTSSSSPYALG